LPAGKKRVFVLLRIIQAFSDLRKSSSTGVSARELHRHVQAGFYRN